MVDIIKIQDEINRLLVQAYPKCTVYVDDIPQKFERPSFYIEYVTSSSETVNKDVMLERAYFNVTFYGEKDNYYSEDRLSNQQVLINMLKPFRRGYINVEDRAIPIKASNGGQDEDEVYMDIQVEYYEDRLDEEATYPLMGDIQVKRRVR